uniref:Uncharacterized protein n=1 Tax=Mesocestoides corti TaxID=53468 RepID=A0A5K3ENY4_MESCO
MDHSKQGFAASIIGDDYKSNDGFRHLASNSLDHGRAPPRPATRNSISTHNSTNNTSQFNVRSR